MTEPFRGVINQSVKSSYALITGASAGIGRELARVMARDGENLILVARRRERLDALAEELTTEHSVAVQVFTCDLSRDGAPDQLYREIEDGGLPVTTLVNNAGFGILGPFAHGDTARQLSMIQLNVTSLAHLTSRFLAGMLERGSGGILNVASTAAFQPGPNMAVYYATKAFVLSFTEALAEEISGSGVHVSCLCPGPTTTEFGDQSGMDATILFRTGTMNATRVAEIGYQKFKRGKLIVIPALKNRIGTFLVRLTPRILVRKVVHSLQK